MSIFLGTFLLTAIYAAKETEYLDWKRSLLYSDKNYIGALSYFSQAVSQDPNFMDAWIRKGNTEKDLKEYNRSIQSNNAALKINGSQAVAWSGIADACSALKNYINASAAAAKATELDGKNKGNWLREGNLLQLQGKYKEAVAKYDAALALDP